MENCSKSEMLELYNLQKKSVSDSQRARSLDGKGFEKWVLEDILKKIGYGIERGGYKVFACSNTCINLKKRHPEIFKVISLNSPLGDYPPDCDIIIFNTENKFILIISAKTSMRERLGNMISTCLEFKSDGKNIPIWLVTQDKDLEFGTNEKSEWGHKGVASKARRQCERHGVRVYSINNNTVIGGNVFPYEKIYEDIINSFP